MVDWYTDERIVETLFQAESLGLNACILRGDEHITRVLWLYWNQGGTMRWIAQSNSRAATSVHGAQYCIDNGASACFLHGGEMDHYVAQGRHDAICAFVETVKAAGLPVGAAGHMPRDFVWAEESLQLDFYMVCYYNPSRRDDVPHHDPSAAEQYLVADRDERVALIQRLSKPVIHYKIMAAGRTDPEEAIAFAAKHMRVTDAICVGVHTKDKADMIATDVALLLESLQAVGQL